MPVKINLHFYADAGAGNVGLFLQLLKKQDMSPLREYPNREGELV